MRVLIVEDEPVIALEIESIVHERLPEAETVVASSVKEGFGAIATTLTSPSSTSTSPTARPIRWRSS